MDLFSIDPATGRAKHSDEEGKVRGYIFTDEELVADNVIPQFSPKKQEEGKYNTREVL